MTITAITKFVAYCALGFGIGLLMPHQWPFWEKVLVGALIMWAIRKTFAFFYTEHTIPSERRKEY